MKAVAIVVMRLNSNRLPGKQLLDLAGKPLVERVFERLDCIEQIDHTVLATTADPYNQPLLDWAQQAGREAFAYPGDVDDVMGRVTAVVANHEADVVVTISGDSPMIEPTTLGRMVHALKQQPEHDIVSLIPYERFQYSVHEGFGVFSRKYWDAMNEASILPYERENMASVGGGRLPPQHVLKVDDDEIYYRLDHRMSVDTVSDYRFMSSLYQRWYHDHPQSEIVSLAWAVEQLQRDPGLGALNADVQQRLLGEKLPKVLLITEAGAGVGLGHLSRCAVVGRALQDHAKAGIRIVAVGEAVDIPSVELLPVTWVQGREALVDYLESSLEQFNTVLMDLKEDDDWHKRLTPYLKKMQDNRIVVAALDGWVRLEHLVDLFWFPSFYLADRMMEQIPEEKRFHGWDCYLLQSRELGCGTVSDTPHEILVALGGSDVDGLGETLPPLLQQKLPDGAVIHWIQGPYAAAPRAIESGRIHWRCYRSPSNLLELFSQCDIALVSYGVTLFELLNMGKPVVALRTSAGPDDEEWQAFVNAGLSSTVDQAESAVDELMALMAQPQRMRELSSRCCKRLETDGGKQLALRIAAHVKEKRESE